MGRIKLDVNLNLFNDKLVRKVFLPHPSSPARRGSTSLLNPPILRREDLKPGRLGLYSQTSARPQGVARECLRNRSAIILCNRVAIV